MRKLLVAAALVLVATPAWAVQVQDLVRIKGAESSKIVGMGLVMGLPGTGDGGKFLPAMRPLASVIQTLMDPNTVAAELKDAKNVAVVTLTATLPAAGVREGDRVDVYVAAYGPAKSLKGGRLFLIPMTGPLPGSPVFAYAEGPVVIEDPETLTTGVIRGGAQLTRDVMARYLDSHGRLTLVLHDSVASWPMSNNLASLINGVIAPDGPNIAKAIDQKNVIIAVPAYEQQDPAAFISQILQSYVDPSQIGSGARVVINERSGTIVISGDVQISPVIISHKGLTITTMTPAPAPPLPNDQPPAGFNPGGGAAQQQAQGPFNFVGIDPERRGGARLTDLLAAFNQLKVGAADRIAIVKEIHRSGKLHAQLVLE